MAEQQAAQIHLLRDSLAQIERQIIAFEAQREQRDTLGKEIAILTGESNGLLTVNQTLEKEMDSLRSRLQSIKTPHEAPVAGCAANISTNSTKRRSSNSIWPRVSRTAI